MSAALIFGLLIGVLLGALGGGGSILAVPALVHAVGMPPAAAVPASLAVVGISSVTSALPRLRQVQWRLAAVFGAAGALAAFGGAAVNRLLSPTAVLVGFGGVMIIAGLQMLRERRQLGGACALPGGGVDWRGCLPKAVAAGLVVGFLTGLFGVGGGFLIVPALVVLLGLEMTAAVATSLVIIAVNSAAGFAAHAGEAAIDVRIVGVFAVAAVIGSVLGGRLARHLPADRLRRWFAYLVLAVAVFMIVAALR